MKTFRKVLLITLIVIAVGVVSWLITCGIVNLIMKCFDMHYTWKIGTGIWLILWFIDGIINGNRR